MVIVWAVVVLLGRLGSFAVVGLVSHSMGATWWRGGCGLALGGGSTLWATLVGTWWLLVEDAMSQVCDFGTINVQLAREINNMMWCSVLPCFKPLLLQTRHLHPFVRIHPILGMFWIGTLIGYMLKDYTTHNLILVCVILNRGRRKS